MICNLSNYVNDCVHHDLPANKITSSDITKIMRGDGFIHYSITHPNYV